jgi:cell division protein FtsA
MKNFSLKLFLEINFTDLVFLVGKNDENNNIDVAYELKVPLNGMDNKRITDFEKLFIAIKKNVYLIEQKFNYTFIEIVLILNNFNLTFINLSGYKKLNGSQILKENIIYILNTLKSYVVETEIKKETLHIFNTEFNLDKKKIDNLPIGLFGDFYAHELSFVLINRNDYKNLKNIFAKCNLSVNKILIKSFVKGSSISENNKNIETFFHIEIHENNVNISYFENHSLKFEQNFQFGSDIVIKDISKITSLKIDTIKKILKDIRIKKEETLDNELINEKFFNNEIYRKIKKKLIYEIAYARIKEILDITILNNINFKHYNKFSNDIFLEIDHKCRYNFFEEIYKSVFLLNKKNIISIDELSSKDILKSVNKIVHFGWKKEAIPLLVTKKSLITRIFNTIFE